jgi:hypothetical protein
MHELKPPHLRSRERNISKVATGKNSSKGFVDGLYSFHYNI